MNAERKQLSCSHRISNMNHHCQEIYHNPQIANNMEEEEEEEEVMELPEIQSYISQLPSNIIMYILNRLPIKTLSRCRCVCKSWHDLILEPYFHNLYYAQSPTVLILEKNIDAIDNTDLCIVDVEDRRVHNRFVVNRNLDGEDRNIRTSELVIGNSCNGLVCLLESDESNFLNPVYIWNPIMGEYVTLPKTINKPGFYSVSGWLGFSPRAKKYKVIRMLRPRDGDGDEDEAEAPWQAEVCTLGMVTWRRIQDAPYRLQHKCVCTFLNGSLHWILNDYKTAELICSFDIGTEKFYIAAPPPPIFSPNNNKRMNWLYLGVLQGCLYICASNGEVFRPDIEVWVMKNYGVKESWVKELSIQDPVVEWWNPCRGFQLIKFLKSGEILVLCGYSVLCAYNPKDRTYRTYVSLNHSEFEVIAHVPSFVSLKDVVNR